MSTNGNVIVENLLHVISFVMEILDNNNENTANMTYSDSFLPSEVINNERISCDQDLPKDSVDDSLPTNCNLDEENKKYSTKTKIIKSVLRKKPINVSKLKKLSMSKGGLVTDELRKIAWPHLLEIENTEVPRLTDEKDVESHPEYQQVVLDVNRSLRRFPPGIPLDQRLAMQNQLIHLILRVIIAHPRLRYYQGYHDVAVTLLLVTGIDLAYSILEKLSNNHLKDCMEPTMEKTSHLLNYVYPLVKHQSEELFEHLEASGVGTMFALPWFLTWFSHSLNHYSDVVRLFDYFLASEPLTPLYLSAVIIEYRKKEILNTPCDMANLHSLLSQIPDDLPFETLLIKTTELYKKHPPEKIQKEALERTHQEEEQRKKEYAIRKRRLNQNLPLLWRMVGHFDPDRRLPIWAFAQPNRIPQSFSRYRYLMATATFAVGLYAVYLKTVEAASVNEDR